MHDNTLTCTIVDTTHMCVCTRVRTSVRAVVCSVARTHVYVRYIHITNKSRPTETFVRRCHDEDVNSCLGVAMCGDQPRWLSRPVPPVTAWPHHTATSHGQFREIAINVRSASATESSQLSEDSTPEPTVSVGRSWAVSRTGEYFTNTRSHYKQASNRLS